MKSNKVQLTKSSKRNQGTRMTKQRLTDPTFALYYNHKRFVFSSYSTCCTYAGFKYLLNPHYHVLMNGSAIIKTF